MSTSFAGVASNASISAFAGVTGFAGVAGSAGASLDLNFLLGVLDGRITASGGAGGTRVNSSGTLVAANAPRFDYDPLTLAAKGVLIEEPRTNLFVQSAAFDNAAWTSAQASVTPNVVTGPDGTASGDKLVEDNTTNPHQVSQTVAVTSGQNYTMTVYPQAATRTAHSLRMNTTGYGALVTGSFNLSAVTAAVATPGTGTSVSIAASGGNWFRSAITSQATASASTAHLIMLENPAGTRTYAGDGTSGDFFWGAQLEQAAFATSYIPTGAAAVTRTLDSLSMTGANFTSWFNNAQGTFVLSGDCVSPNTYKVYLQVDDGTTNNRILIDQNAGAIRLVSFVGGVSQAVCTLGTVAANTPFKVACAFANGDYAASLNGAAAVASAGTLPTVNQMRIGNDGVNWLNGHVATIKFYPSRLPNATLQSLST